MLAYMYNGIIRRGLWPPKNFAHRVRHRNLRTNCRRSIVVDWTPAHKPARGNMGKWKWCITPDMPEIDWNAFREKMSEARTEWDVFKQGEYAWLVHARRGLFRKAVPVA